MCFLLRAQNGVELTFLLVYILLHKAIGCLQQHKGPLKKWTESSKLVISISGATCNVRNLIPTQIGVELTFISIIIYFAAQGHWLFATRQEADEEMDEILKIHP